MNNSNLDALVHEMQAKVQANYSIQKKNSNSIIIIEDTPEKSNANVVEESDFFEVSQIESVSLRMSGSKEPLKNISNKRQWNVLTPSSKLKLQVRKEKKSKPSSSVMISDALTQNIGPEENSHSHYKHACHCPSKETVLHLLNQVQLLTMELSQLKQQHSELHKFVRGSSSLKEERKEQIFPKDIDISPVAMNYPHTPQILNMLECCETQPFINNPRTKSGHSDSTICDATLCSNDLQNEPQPQQSQVLTYQLNNFQVDSNILDATTCFSPSIIENASDSKLVSSEPHVDSRDCDSKAGCKMQIASLVEKATITVENKDEMVQHVATNNILKSDADYHSTFEDDDSITVCQKVIASFDKRTEISSEVYISFFYIFCYTMCYKSNLDCMHHWKYSIGVQTGK